MIIERCRSWISMKMKALTTPQSKKSTSSKDAKLRDSSIRWNVCRLQEGDDRLLPLWTMRNQMRVMKKEE